MAAFIPSVNNGAHGITEANSGHEIISIADLKQEAGSPQAFYIQTFNTFFKCAQEPNPKKAPQKIVG